MPTIRPVRNKRKPLPLTQMVELQLRSVFKADEIKREYRFHPVRMWRFDFAIPAYKIAVEVHGSVYQVRGGKKCQTCGQFPRGGHLRGAQYESDREKMNEAALAGWLVLELTKTLINSGKSLAQIEAAAMIRREEMERRV